MYFLVMGSAHMCALVPLSSSFKTEIEQSSFKTELTNVRTDMQAISKHNGTAVVHPHCEPSTESCIKIASFQCGEEEEEEEADVVTWKNSSSCRGS